MLHVELELKPQATTLNYCPEIGVHYTSTSATVSPCFRAASATEVSPLRRLTSKVIRRFAVHRSIGSADSDSRSTYLVRSGPCSRGSLNFKGSRLLLRMDGKGCWRYNVFVERLWKTIKYEEVYLHAYETVRAAHQGLARYLTFYTQTRPNQARDGKMPDQGYFNNLPTRRTAA